MKLKIPPHFWQAIGMGALAGMRSTAAPFISSYILSRHTSDKLGRSRLGFMQSKNAAKVTGIMALGELVADKLPTTGDRIQAGGVTGRCLSGALAGAATFEAIDANPITGALVGAAAAYGATYGSFYLRKSIVEKTKIADPIIGAIEDAIVIGAGICLVRLAAKLAR